MKMDDSWEFERFRAIAKFYDARKELTLVEKKHLKELGLDVEW